METTNDEIQEILDKLLNTKDLKNGDQIELSKFQVIRLIEKSKEIIINQPVLLELEGPIQVVGDIHGQYYDLLKIFEIGGFPPNSNYLFLGDYVDRGKNSIETICLLLAFKIKYPENFFILRGNHECEIINRQYGFYDECKKRYNIKIFKLFTDLFNNLPIAGLIDNKIFCVHGGISQDLINLQDINKISRPTEIPMSGLLCDLLWSDPSGDVDTYTVNDRGISYIFSKKDVQKFSELTGVDLIVRAHQVIESGYEFFCDKQLLTIFSAPNYLGEFNNTAAIMLIDENLQCSFKTIK